MATENGLEFAKKARRHVERLRERMEWLESLERIHELQHLEILAIEWALPILEAEVDYLRSHSVYTRDFRRDTSPACPACGAIPGRGDTIQKREPRLFWDDGNQELPSSRET